MTVEKAWAVSIAERVKGNTMTAHKNEGELSTLRERLSRMEVEREYAKRQSDNILTWKEKIDEHASPTQLKELVCDVKQLKVMQTQIRAMLAIVLFVATPALSIFMAWLFKPKAYTPPPTRPAVHSQPSPRK